MDPSRRCTARSTRSGQQCRKPAVRGATVCQTHGGGAPQVKEAAAGRVATEQARQAAVVYGVPVDIDPAEGLLDEVARTYGHVLYLLERVRAQDPGSLVWGVTEQSDKHATEFPGVDTTYQAKPNAWLTAYREERAHFVKVCAETLKAGVEERRVRLAERRGEELATWMRALADAWGVPDTPETWRKARARLEVLDGGLAS